MENFVLNRYQVFTAKIDKLPDLKYLRLKNPSSVANSLSEAVADLKEHFAKQWFTDQQTEICFFKYDAPKFYSEYIYALELFTVESNKHHGDEPIVKAYYEQELRFIRRFFDQYRYLYQYYLLDGFELDTIYFTLGAKMADLPLPESPDADPDFAAPATYLFAKFIALERLQSHLMNLIYPVRSMSPLTKPDTNRLRWTGDKINLVELAYGIYNTAQLNEGEAQITEIIFWLENSLQVKLTRFFQMHSEIKGRKSVSKTRYLDHMAKMINQHIEQGDAFVPKKPRSVSGSKSAAKP